MAHNEFDDMDAENGLPIKMPGHEGIFLIMTRGKYVLFDGENRTSVIDNVDDLAKLYSQIHMRLKIAHHPILDLYAPSGFIPPSDHPSRNPN